MNSELRLAYRSLTMEESDGGGKMDKQPILIADKMKIKSENHESFVILFGTQENSSLHPTKPYQHFQVH
jgi:hypothetical protein